MYVSIKCHSMSVFNCFFFFNASKLCQEFAIWAINQQHSKGCTWGNENTHGSPLNLAQKRVRRISDMHSAISAIIVVGELNAIRISRFRNFWWMTFNKVWSGIVPSPRKKKVGACRLFFFFFSVMCLSEDYCKIQSFYAEITFYSLKF